MNCSCSAERRRAARRGAAVTVWTFVYGVQLLRGETGAPAPSINTQRLTDWLDMWRKMRERLMMMNDTCIVLLLLKLAHTDVRSPCYFLTFLSFRDHRHIFVGQSSQSLSSTVCFQSCQMSVHICSYRPCCCRYIAPFLLFLGARQNIALGPLFNVCIILRWRYWHCCCQFVRMYVSKKALGESFRNTFELHLSGNGLYRKHR